MLVFQKFIWGVYCIKEKERTLRIQSEAPSTSNFVSSVSSLFLCAIKKCRFSDFLKSETTLLFHQHHRWIQRIPSKFIPIHRQTTRH